MTPPQDRQHDKYVIPAMPELPAFVVIPLFHHVRRKIRGGVDVRARKVEQERWLRSSSR